MSHLSPWNIGVAGIFVFIVGFWVSFAKGVEPSTQPVLPEMSHVVAFKIGSITADDEDNITITQVLGTSDKIAVGGTYTVKGTYHLVSKDQAMMAVFVTASTAESAHSVIGPVYREDQVIGKGDGEFSLIFTMTSKGSPHLSVYPTDGGSSIASVYFGMGDSLQK